MVLTLENFVLLRSAANHNNNVRVRVTNKNLTYSLYERLAAFQNLRLHLTLAEAAAVYSMSSVQPRDMLDSGRF